MKTQKHQGSDNSARMESKYKLNLAQITSIVLTSAEAYFHVNNLIYKLDKNILLLHI
jgi:hypothetical protein